MPNQRIVTAVSAAGLVAVGCVIAAQSTASAAPATRTSEQHFVLVDHTGPTYYADVEPAGVSVGDSFTFSEKVFAHGRNVGTAGGVCTEVAVSDASTTQQCTITAVLAAGQLVVTGIAGYPATGGAPPATYAIVGGTDAYKTARGQVVVTPVKDGSDRIAVDVITG